MSGELPIDEPTSAIPKRRNWVPRPFDLFVVVVAAVSSWSTYWSIRQPTGLEAFVGIGLGFFVLLPIGIWAACALVRRLFAEEPLRRPAFCLVAASAPWIAFWLGVAAARRDFEQWRRPVYEKVIAALRRDGRVDDETSRAKRESWLRDLTPDERATFKSFNLERDDAGKLSWWFYWAGSGPPPTHHYYVWFEAGRPDQETLRHGSFGSLGDGWYIGND